MATYNEQDIKIAVLEREVAGLREQQKAHKEEITKSLTDIGNNFKESVIEIRNDIKYIYEFVNRIKGSFTILILAASALGGIVVAISEFLIAHFIHA
jgi:hypothetical protein